MTNSPPQNVIELDRMRHPPGSGDFASKRAVPGFSFHSILYAGPEDRRSDDTLGMPAFFTDLNCDQIVEAITAEREEYNLKPFFHDCLRRRDAVIYRHEAIQDLEKPSLLERVNSFARKMREMRAHLERVQKLHYKEQKQAWFVDSVELYCHAIQSFAEDLYGEDLESRGFLGFAGYLSRYASSVRFRSLVLQTTQLKEHLAEESIAYSSREAASRCENTISESDYSATVEETFEKFKQGAAKDYKVKFSASEDMNHIEAKVLEFVARLYPDVFSALDDYCATNAGYLDETVAAFDREIQFYIAYLEYIAALKRSGLRFCYPSILDKGKEIYDYEGFDIALAHKLKAQNSPVVCNDFHLEGKERILVVSGPNQGGKTTFARAFGQLHYLASIGCPVPGGRRSSTYSTTCLRILKEKKRSKISGASSRTTCSERERLSIRLPPVCHRHERDFYFDDAERRDVFSAKLMKKLIELDVLAVWVTFVDELASFGPETVSMVSTVVPDNPALRTFKIVRQPADGLAYAMAIAQKHGLTYESIKQRIKS